jgi:hypothetical protein
MKAAKLTLTLPDETPIEFYFDSPKGAEAFYRTLCDLLKPEAVQSMKVERELVEVMNDQDAINKLFELCAGVLFYKTLRNPSKN